MKEFSYEEVEAATGGFAAKNLVGKGSHGSVYKARLRGDGSRTAVVAQSGPAPGCCSPQAVSRTTRPFVNGMAYRATQWTRWARQAISGWRSRPRWPQAPRPT